MTPEEKAKEEVRKIETTRDELIKSIDKLNDN
jgi:hypothetical protein